MGNCLFKSHIGPYIILGFTTWQAIANTLNDKIKPTAKIQNCGRNWQYLRKCPTWQLKVKASNSTISFRDTHLGRVVQNRGLLTGCKDESCDLSSQLKLMMAPCATRRGCTMRHAVVSFELLVVPTHACSYSITSQSQEKCHVENERPEAFVSGWRKPMW